MCQKLKYATSLILIPINVKNEDYVMLAKLTRSTISLIWILSLCNAAIAQETSKPNIVFVLADNLGWGELGVYGGGELRGAPTPRIDQMASEGFRLQNFNVETECVPTRTALMTGRQAIRTGTYRSPGAGQPNGLVPWEVTIAELLSARGYATALYGKWHLGDREGRYPTNQGFDEWYGISGTSDVSLYRTSIGYDEKVAPPDYVLEGHKGQKTQQVKEYDIEARRGIDTEITKRTIAFMRRNVLEKKPFYAYVPLTQVHFPTLPSHEFEGKTGNGDFADSVVETDYHVGQILDAIKELGIDKDTMVIFTSDNGPEFRRPWQGTAGYWRGTYYTVLEGSLRTPFIMRWPDHVPAGRVSNEIVHASDMFTTLAHLAGSDIPHDRAIDGVDESGLLLGKKDKSNRDGFLAFVGEDLYAVKWRNWKVHFIWLEDVTHGPIKLPERYAFNLLRDPKEETDVMSSNTWIERPIFTMIDKFNTTLKQYPPVPPGSPDTYTPTYKGSLEK